MNARDPGDGKQLYSEHYPGILRYYENEVNLRYDTNIRNLVEKATGEFCFFMGNDDVMCPGACLSRHKKRRRLEELYVVR